MPARGYDSAPVLIAALVGVLSAVVFVLLERRRGDAAMLPTGLFSSRLFSVLNIFTVVVYAALTGFTFFFAVYLQNVVEWSAFRTGIALLPMTLLLLVGSARSGALSARIAPGCS